MKLIRGVILTILASLAVFAQVRPEFEVASIKPSAPFNGQVNVGVHVDGAQVRCTYLSLRDYIGIAYKLKIYQISGPDWLGSERFDIAAKLPAGAAREQVAEMVQTLLEDRFRMKTHRGTKEFPVYGLVLGKAGLKMKESPTDPDIDSRDAGKGAVNVTATGSRAGTTINFGKGSYFTFANNKIEGKKMTLVAFADTLGRFADRPVVDMTELKGNYDFTLEFSPEDFLAMTIRSAIAAGVVLPPEAMRVLEGASGDSLFTAVQTLGLKLEPRRAPIEVLVIDQMDKTPTEN